MRKTLILLAVLLLFAGIRGVCAEDTPVINPIEELFNWTFSNNIGMTMLYDLDEEDYKPGAKWGLFTTKHQWLFAGLSGKVSINNEPALGWFGSLNVGKLLQDKVFKKKLQYLDYLEIGYYSVYDFGYKDWRDGVLLNVLKKEF